MNANARAGVMIALLCLSGSAAAESPNRAEVTQKERFVRRLLEAAQPPASADAAPSAMHARALEHLGRGEYKEADALLSEAIRSMQRARRHAPDKPSPQLGSLYERLLSTVELMRSTYARHGSAREDSHGTLLAEVDASVAQARRLRAEQRPSEAVRALELAEQSLTHALTQLLGSVTVSYAERFSGPREQYEHELARNRAYAALVPAALNELRPSGAVLLLVDRYVESGEAMVALAEREAAQARWNPALEKVRSATQYLQRALGAVGLAVPQGITE